MQRLLNALHPLYVSLASLRLTVVLLGASLVLVFFGTLDQVHLGIQQTQAIYFESLIAVWQYPSYWPGGESLDWIKLPIPGGYLIGPLLVINLICAHFRHFSFRFAMIGTVTVHFGIVLLLIGQFVSQVWQEDYYLWLTEGEQSNYLESFSEDELVIIAPTGDGKRGVISIPSESLEDGKEFSFENQIPFTVRIREFHLNSLIRQARSRIDDEKRVADHGLAAEKRLIVEPAPAVFANDQRNRMTAVVEILYQGEVHSTWMLSSVFVDQFPPQILQLEGESYEMALRFKRQYLPFTILLTNFEHTRYPGTSIPSNFSSDVRVSDQETGEIREAHIAMNAPLRYRGWTFFQASFAKQDTASMFQVVRNPGWTIPYISCLLVSFGLIFQFGKSFIHYRRSAKV